MRVPCCEHMGQKKGPWTPEEDQILISYIRKYGHDNWRALPKQAGLLRCGKSCRLRWTNYLRPDIKRGNFSREEEENIIKLHQILGNRWSAIATRLPGRTDNEIKNFWHTHLKKKLQHIQLNNDITINACTKSFPVNLSRDLIPQNSVHAPMLPQKVNENSYSPVVKATRPPEDDHMISFQNAQGMHRKHGASLSPRDDDNSHINEDMEFWFNLFIKAGDQSQNKLEK
ncbi:hypothetical protein Vadar_028660 [Vaccinium darrowii]|uniref:Uncharacterized protein n=1 Tax=Vaccinium darrowii TaxID=229202 RepID=A0ACB7XKL5_9ERIC|nr:hypothetical protein Vadar_028660 [Vaccinium darrowii]